MQNSRFPTQNSRARSLGSFLRRGLDRVILLLALARIGGALPLVPLDGSADSNFLIRYITMCTFALLGGWLYLGQRLDERARLLGIFCLVVASTFASAVANHWLPATAASDWRHRLADLVNHFYVDGFFSWYLWRLVTLYPKAQDLPLTRRVLWLGTQVSLAGALIVEIWAAVAIAFGPGVSFSDETRARAEITPLWFLAAGAFVLFAVRFRRATSLEKSRVRLVAAGLGALFLVLCLVLNSLVSEPSQVEDRALIPISFILFLVFILFTTYAWVVHGALDARLSIQRLVTFRFLQLLIGAVSLAPMATFVFLLDDALNGPPEPLAPNSLFLVLVLAVLSTLIGGAILRWLSGRYRGVPEDRMRALESFSGDLPGIRTGKQLHAALRALGKAGFGTKDTHVLLAPSFPGRYPDLERLPHNSLLPGLFELRNAPLLRENQDPYEPEAKLTESDRQLLDSFGSSVVAPIRSPDGFVLAVLAVGQKSNQLPYTPPEVEAIGQAALLASFKLAQWFLDQSETLAQEADAASRCVICDKVAAADQRTCPSCDGPTAEADVPWKLEDRFLFEQRVGQGAFGSVYRARDLRLHRQVAIKVLRGQRGSRLALTKEAGAMAQLEHPHIAAVFGIEKWAGQRLMVTEYLEGGTLEKRLRQGPLEEQDAIFLVQDVATALRSAHSRGFLHGDIKPSNIGFTGDGRCKLIDLGLTSLMSETPNEFTSTGSKPSIQDTCQLPGGGMGTPLYASPEMWASLPPDKTDDLWGLAAVLFEASTGTPPFVGANADEVGELVRAGKLSSDISQGSMSPQLARLVRRGLAPEPASRFVDAEELLRELHKTWPSLDRRRL